MQRADIALVKQICRDMIKEELGKAMEGIEAKIIPTINIKDAIPDPDKEEKGGE